MPRELVDLAERADDALRTYADALRKWNAPDDVHTRQQLRQLVEDVIDETILATQGNC